MIPFLALVALADPLPSLADIVPDGAKVEKVAGGFRFTEGPIWTRRGTLLFSDIPANRIYELWRDGLVPSVFREPSHNANGNTLDRQGRLITCEHGSRRVTRTERNGRITVLAERFDGKRLNSPNDAVVRSDGTIYFTDPPYGIRREQQELGFSALFRITPRGTVEPLVRDFRKPNGVALSPDEKTLYVADTEGGHIRAFPVRRDGSVAGGRVFATLRGNRPGAPDGIRVDRRGNVYCTGPGGIHVIDPSGQSLGIINVPEVATNCGWGGLDARTLYITAVTGLYRVRLKIPGVRP